MNNEYILKEIQNYMKNPLDYAIILSGEWGCGKTHFIKHELKDVDNYYFTLNGISSLSDVAMQIIYKLAIDTSLELKKNKISKFLSKVDLKKATPALKMLLSRLEKKYDFSTEEVFSLIKNIKLSQKKLYIFDDLERCSLPLESILGFINNLVENNNVKVLIVANENDIINDDTKVKYLKVKEKLIYQTLNYIPDLNCLYDNLMCFEFKEVISSKEFVLREFKRQNHYNIRTLNFIFQRYKELRKLMDDIISHFKYSQPLIETLYRKMFEFFVVAARDYKVGSERVQFKDDIEIGTYALVPGNINAITSFKFIYDFIHGDSIDVDCVTKTLKDYLDTQNEEIFDSSSSLAIIGNWWEEEDESIKISTDLIIKNLRNKKYSFEIYPKILLYLIRIVDAGFSESFLCDSIDIMKSNISEHESIVAMGNRIIDVNVDPEQLEKFNSIKDDLMDFIRKHNSVINTNEIDRLKELPCGKMGGYLYQWYADAKTRLSDIKSFISYFGIQNIDHIVECGNTRDIRFLIYLFNDIYSFSNVKDFYINDLDLLMELSEKLKGKETRKYSIMKLFSLNCLINTVDKVVDSLSE